MELTEILHTIGVLNVLGYGILSLLRPHSVAKTLAQGISTPRGVAEFRVLHGGFFAAVGAYALIVNEPTVYAALGVGWFGAAAGRAFAWIVDRPPLSTLYIGSFVFEIVMGVLLVV